ncbi:MAG TPA: ABC transporter ATP-binding protein [bacterium]|nr:ABC transporter ATP-binding protein [bacterium]
MAEVVLENAVKDFGGTRAVDDVSLTVGDGEFFTLLGPSGCGKTTTLRLVAGLEYADSGRVLIGGRDVTRVPPAGRRIAMVFQNYALYPHMTIRENIGYPLKLKKKPERELNEKVDEVARRLGIEQVLARSPAAISGGQQQRAAVARAMVGEPLVYLFDEPLSNLDARLRLESRRFLKHVLRETGGTAVYVTHDQTEAMALSDRVAVMKEGRLIQVAAPEELYARPASTFVAGFVGHLPMNLIEGEVRMADGPAFCAGDLRVKLPAGTAGRDGARATLGARPEDLALTMGGGIRGRVEDVEELGSEKIVTVSCRGVALIVRVVVGQAPRPGDEADVIFDPARVHLFDEKGERID